MLFGSENKEEKQKLPLHVYLVYLVALTMVFTGVSFSKYMTKSTGGDAARIVTFGDTTLTETGDFDDTGNLVIVPGVDLEKKALVSFEESETASYIFVKVVNGTEWKQSTGDPYKFQMAGQKVYWSVDQNQWKFLTKDETDFVFYKLVEPNTKVENSNIITENKVYVSDQLTRSELEKLDKTQLSVKFTAMSMQYDGLEKGLTEIQHAQKAWQSGKKK